MRKRIGYEKEADKEGARTNREVYDGIIDVEKYEVGWKE